MTMMATMNSIRYAISIGLLVILLHVVSLQLHSSHSLQTQTQNLRKLAVTLTNEYVDPRTTEFKTTPIQGNNAAMDTTHPIQYQQQPQPPHQHQLYTEAITDRVDTVDSAGTLLQSDPQSKVGQSDVLPTMVIGDVLPQLQQQINHEPIQGQQIPSIHEQQLQRQPQSETHKVPALPNLRATAARGILCRIT
jgi:hypothetical protein